METSPDPREVTITGTGHVEIDVLGELFRGITPDDPESKGEPGPEEKRDKKWH